VTAVDVSEKALAVARCNAEANGTDITFIQADILDPKNIESQYSTFDLIFSNPPYVRDSERMQIAANVLDYDPALALFVPDDDPLRFYSAIADIASRSLAPDGLLAVEINEALADETCTLLRGMGFDPITNTDFRNRPRWITATRKEPISCLRQRK
jgi:release factor glutamine methyltransferase